MHATTRYSRYLFNAVALVTALSTAFITTTAFASAIAESLAKAPKTIANSVASTLVSGEQWAEHCNDQDSWDKPGPAFQIYGNSYYVGSCGITAILLTSEQGHILIDSGTERGADIVANNIQALGFKLSDVKILLHSHEHFDHVAGLSKLQHLTGAKLLASTLAAPVLRTGESDLRDPQAGQLRTFPGVRVDGLVSNGSVVTLGPLSLTALTTPGHTLGALSWSWQSCQATRCLTLVYADSLSAISNNHYRFSDHPQYLEDYRHAIAKVGQLTCQLLLTPHPSASDMRTRLASSAGLIDSTGCQRYAAKLTAKLDKRLASEQ